MASNSTTNTAPGSAGQNGAHTPGPWEIEPKQEGTRGHWLRTADGELLALACKMDSEATELANARLIAAAPDVVEHARRVMGLLAEHGPSIVPHLLDSDDNAGQKLRTALAAATGEAV